MVPAKATEIARSCVCLGTHLRLRATKHSFIKLLDNHDLWSAIACAAESFEGRIHLSKVKAHAGRSVSSGYAPESALAQPIAAGELSFTCGPVHSVVDHDFEGTVSLFLIPPTCCFRSSSQAPPAVC